VGRRTGWCFRSEGFLVLGWLVGLSEAAIWVDWSWCREEGAQAGVPVPLKYEER
jgi:hypothetical protein